VARVARELGAQQRGHGAHGALHGQRHDVARLGLVRLRVRVRVRVRVRARAKG